MNKKKMLEDIMDIKLMALTDLVSLNLENSDFERFINNYSISDELRKYRDISTDKEFGRYVYRGIDVLEKYFKKADVPLYLFRFLVAGK